MNQTQDKPKEGKREFIWRGSSLSVDLVDHEEFDGDGNKLLTPCLQIMYRARIPLNGNTHEERVRQAKSLARNLGKPLGSLPTVDELKTWMSRSLKTPKRNERREWGGRR